MEHHEMIQQEISAFLDRFHPKSETDIQALKRIQVGFESGQSLESQFEHFIAIGDQDLLRAFYERVPDLRDQILAHPHCPSDLKPQIKGKHPLLSLDQSIDLDLKGLISYEASLPAGEIDGPERTGCLRRIENLQRQFDRVPSALHETDLTDNQNPLFYDLLLAKQRLASNLKVFTRLRINLANRFAKVKSEKEEQPEQALPEEPKQEEPQQSDPTETDAPIQEEQDALAALLAEQEAKAAQDAKTAEKKIANEKRQQRLRQQAKEQEESTYREQRQQEEASRHPNIPVQSAPYIPPYEYSTPPAPTFDEQTEVLRRREQEHKETVLQETQQKLDEHHTAEKEHIQQYQERMDRSYSYESFGKSHIDFSGHEQHGSGEVYPYVPTDPVSTPIPVKHEPESKHSAVQPDPENRPFYAQPQDVPSQDNTNSREEQGFRAPRYDQQQKAEFPTQNQPPVEPTYQPKQLTHIPSTEAQQQTSVFSPAYQEQNEPQQRQPEHGQSYEHRDQEYRIPEQQREGHNSPQNIEYKTPEQSREYQTENPVIESRVPEQAKEHYDTRPSVEYKKTEQIQEYRAAEQARESYPPERPKESYQPQQTIEYRTPEQKQNHAGTTKSEQSPRQDYFEHRQTVPEQSRNESTVKDSNRSEPFRPYIYTPGGGVAAAYSDAYQQSSRPSNPEIYQTAIEQGKITPEMSQTMRDNLNELHKEYEASKGTPAFQEVSQRYQQSRAAVMAITNDIRNNQITVEQDTTKATNTANVSRTYRPERNDSYTAYQYTPTGVQGTTYEKGTASGGVIVHNTPGTVGKQVYSKESPMLVTKSYEETLAKDANLARAQLYRQTNPAQAPDKPVSFTPTELTAYKTSIDAYEGYRRAKEEGLVKVTSDAGALNTPNQAVWAARQETYRQTTAQHNPYTVLDSDANIPSGGRNETENNRRKQSDFKGDPVNDFKEYRGRQDDRRNNNNDRRDGQGGSNNNDRRKERDENKNNGENTGHDGSGGNGDRGGNGGNGGRGGGGGNGGNGGRGGGSGNGGNGDRGEGGGNGGNGDRGGGGGNGGNGGRGGGSGNGGNGGRGGGDGNGDPRPEPKGRTPRYQFTPFGSIFTINYNRRRYTSWDKASGTKLLNKETKMKRDGALRKMGSRIYQNYAAYVPEASIMAGRKMYYMLQASNESGAQSIRTFEQTRYYTAACAGLVLAQATKNVGNIKRFERSTAKTELHQYGFQKHALSDKEISRKFHTQVNQGRSAKKEIRRMYEQEANLTPAERRLLAKKIREHKSMGTEIALWAGLHNTRKQDKIKKEILDELHRNREGYGLVTDHALKDLQEQRKQIQLQRREILNSQPERASLNKRIAELQKKGKENLTDADLAELKELRGKLSKLSSDPRLTALDQKEQELLKLYKKKPDETSVGSKRISLKEANKMRDKILHEHDLLEKEHFKEFYGVKTSVIQKNKRLLERQSETAKLKVKKLSAKDKLTAGEEKELRKLKQLLKNNQDKIKSHADILNLRKARDLKVEAIDDIRKSLMKNEQRKRIGKMALVDFIIKPLQQGDNGAQGVAKAISISMNPYVHRLVRSSVDKSLRFTKFAARKVGKVTGLDKTLAPAIDKTKQIYAGARKIANTPKELKKKAIKTAVKATKSAANKMTPKFIKTGASAVRKKMSNLALKLQKSKLGKVYETITRNLSKLKSAISAAARVVSAILGKIALGLVALILIAGLITVIGGAIGGSIPSFLVMGDETTDDGKIDLTPYAEVFNEELLEFQEKVIAAKTAKTYENVTEICYGPTDYNNIREVISMMAVRMSQDLDMDENPDVEKYIRSIFEDSHIITTVESEPYSCSGCKTRTVKVGHSDSCPEDCTTTHTETEVYCPGKHVDLTLTVTTLVFDEIFTADTMGNEDQSVIAGGLIGDDFEITFYLPTGNKTASGTEPEADRTIAVDPNVIPLGTHVIIDGKEYIAEDTGGAIQGHIIDIFVEKESDIPSAGRLKNVSVYYADYEGEGIMTSEEWNGWVEENRTWAKTIYNAPWDELYYGLDAVGAYIEGDWSDYDWDSFEYSDETNLTQAQQRVAHIAQNSASFGISATAGYCQQWVRLVYTAAGYGGGNAASANAAGDQWLVSSDYSNIPVGSAVYGHSSSVYGHVGIYVGDGKVYHNIGGVDVDTLEDWVSKYKGYGWGWQGGHDLTNS